MNQKNSKNHTVLLNHKIIAQNECRIEEKIAIKSKLESWKECMSLRMNYRPCSRRQSPNLSTTMLHCPGVMGSSYMPKIIAWLVFFTVMPPEPCKRKCNKKNYRSCCFEALKNPSLPFAGTKLGHSQSTTTGN